MSRLRVSPKEWENLQNRVAEMVIERTEAVSVVWRAEGNTDLANKASGWVELMSEIQCRYETNFVVECPPHPERN